MTCIKWTMEVISCVSPFKEFVPDLQRSLLNLKIDREKLTELIFVLEINDDIFLIVT